MTEKIQQAIMRYITSTATADDLEMLSEWCKVPANKKTFECFLKDHYSITHSVNDPNSEQAINRLLSALQKKQRLRLNKKRQILTKYAAAVSAIIILFGTYYFINVIFTLNLSSPSSKEIKVGTDKATLTLADGSEVELGKEEVFQEENYKSNGTQLEYDNDKDGQTGKIAYHFLTVPRGGKFMITLSDGTKVWLNSDSRLKYPTNFRSKESRKVELVYGEAYFDVSPSTEHQGSDFLVYNSGQEVKVLGTEFNIKAYIDDSDILTTLVEGKVNLKINNKEQVLAPGQQAKYDFDKKAIVTKTIDIYNETSWKDGVFSFDNKPLSEIMKVLSRWYDVEFKIGNEDIKTEEFIGSLSKNQEIEEILSQIKNTGIINNYKIEKNEVKIE